MNEQVSFRTPVTGLAHAVTLIPKDTVRVSLNPADSTSQLARCAYLRASDGQLLAAEADIRPYDLLAQVRSWLDVNRGVLEAFWRGELDSYQLRGRLQRV